MPAAIASSPQPTLFRTRTFRNESAEYRAARTSLLKEEIELRRHRASNASHWSGAPCRQAGGGW